MAQLTRRDREHRSERQRQRRLAERTCGNCGVSADVMVPLGSQRIPMCRQCSDLLTRPGHNWREMETVGLWCPWQKGQELPCQACCTFRPESPAAEQIP